MTEDQLDRAINFILDQQAKTDAIVQGLGYKNTETEAILRQTEAILHQMAGKHADTGAILNQMAGKHAETEATLDRVGVRLDMVSVKLDRISEDLAILTADTVTTDYELSNHGDEIYRLIQLTEAQSQAINRLIDLSERSNERHKNSEEWRNRWVEQQTRSEERHERSEKMMEQLAESLDRLTGLVEKQNRAGRNGDSAH